MRAPPPVETGNYTTFYTPVALEVTPIRAKTCSVEGARCAFDTAGVCGSIPCLDVIWVDRSTYAQLRLTGKLPPTT